MNESQTAAISDAFCLVGVGIRADVRSAADDLRAEVRATVYWLWALLFALSSRRRPASRR